MSRNNILILLSLLAVALSCSKPEKSALYSGERRLVIENGISNNRIRDIVEDSLGHIWAATFRGLNCYDGYQYYAYFAENDSTGLPENQCNSLLLDNSGRLWVTTLHGVAYYNEVGDFTKVTVSDKDKYMRKMIQNRQGDIIGLSSSAISLYHPQRNCMETRQQIAKEEKGYVQNIFLDSNDKLWLATAMGLHRYDSHSLSLEQSVALGRPAAAVPLASVQMDEENHLWLSFWGELQWFDMQTSRFVAVPTCLMRDMDLSHDIVMCVKAFEDGYLVSTLKHGLYYYNKVKQEVLHEDSNGFPIDPVHRSVRSIFVDRRGNVWLGTEHHGLLVRYNYRATFNANAELRGLVAGHAVSAIATDQRDRLWIATYDGRLLHFDMGTSTGQNVAISNLPEGEKENSFFALLSDSSGRLWAATGDKVMQLEYISQGQASIVRSWDVNSPMSMAEAADGQIWITTSSPYCYQIDPLTGVLSSRQTFNTDWTFIPVIKRWNEGELLAAAYHERLAIIDATSQQVRQVKIKEDDLRRSIVRSDFIPTDLLVDGTSNIWVGTVSNGLLHCDLATGAVRHIDGIPCSDVCAIQKDDKGRLWISTMYGLCRYDPAEETVTTYYEQDGIGGNQFYDRCAVRLADGTLVFGGTHGLTVFNPADMDKRDTVSIAFEQLFIHNQLVKPGPGQPIERHLALKPDIHLSHSDNAFTILFSALDYSEHPRVRYQYKMEGWDRDFVDAHEGHEAYYSNLPSGDYTFIVQATTGDSKMVVGQDCLRIHVSPAPWLSWWAWMLYVVLATAGAWEIIKVRRRILTERRAKQQAEAEKAEEQRINKMNMSFFANISHELRTPLTMIAGPVQQIASATNLSAAQRSLIEIVQRSIDRMLRLVNQVMDFGKLDQDALKLQVAQGDIVRELRETLGVFRVGAQEKQIAITSTGLDDSLLVWYDSDKVEKILSNLMSNAIKFTPTGGTIAVEFDTIPLAEARQLFSDLPASGQTWMKVCVRDTGSGIPEDKREQIFERYAQLDNQTRLTINWGTGIGLYYTRRLAQLHHGAVKAEGNPSGVGSCFVFVLPIDAEAYTGQERVSLSKEQKNLFPLPDKTATAYDDDEDEERDLVLLVDDDPDVISYLRTLISPQYRVEYRFDAESAFKTIGEVQPSLVLSDVAMPGKDGTQLCRQVKDDPQLCHIPVILITAKTTVQDQIAGLSSGADAYVTKPFNPELLMAMIASQLSNRKKIQAMLKDTTDADELVEDVLSPHDKALMQQLYGLLEESLSNADLDITSISERLGLSRTKLYYKIKGLTGNTPSAFFKNYKLNRAAQLIREGHYDISEIAYMTGFNTLSHFSTSFKQKYGVSPRDYK